MSTESTDARTDSRARRTRRLIGYNLLTTIVLLVSIELGLRLFQLPTPVTPPRIEFGAPIPSELEQFYPADADLFWVYADYAEQIAVAQRRHPSVVFMGDSCTDRGRYDKALQSLIKARNPNALFTFENVGVLGWSSWQGLQQLQRDVLPMRPKAVTIYFGWNDHWINFGMEDKHAAKFIRQRESPPGSPGDALLSRLRTIRLAERTLLAAKGYFADHSPLRVSLADFDANLRQMVRIAHEHGIIPILLTAPTSHQRGREPAYLAERWVADLEDLVPLHRRYADAVRRVAAEENAPLVDLHREFGQLPQRELDRFFWEDGIHLTKAGNRRIAELIDRHLVRADLHWRIVGGEPRSRALEEPRFKEVIEGARLLASNRVDIWLDGDRLLYVKEGRCVGSAEEPEEPFFLHVAPLHPSDLPENRKEYGYDNLDFDIADDRLRLGISHRCVVARRLPKYAVASIRTGQFVESSFERLWEEEIRF